MRPNEVATEYQGAAARSLRSSITEINDRSKAAISLLDSIERKLAATRIAYQNMDDESAVVAQAAHKAIVASARPDDIPSRSGNDSIFKALNPG